MSGEHRNIPIIPLRQAVLFPGSLLPIAVARPKTVAAIKAVETTGETLGFVTQRDRDAEDPSGEELHSIGTIGRIVKAVQMGDRGLQLVVEGVERFHVIGFSSGEPYLRADVELAPDETGDVVETRALILALKKTAREVFALALETPGPATELLESITDGGKLADLIAATIDINIDEKLEVLGHLDVIGRLSSVLALLSRKLEVLKLSTKINTQVREEIDKNQREHYLRQQMKAIRTELGEEEGDESDLEALEERLQAAALPEQAKKIADKELKRLKQIPHGSPEYGVARTYLEWIADLPWSKSSEDTLDIANARKVLDAKHYGLESVKKRIVEFLAVRKLKNDLKGPILCLVGPPGVGKTSLAQSVAQTLGRKLHRVSLGGVRDEAEVRGHRRTYVGALPGRIVQGLKKAGTNNPVFVLDEVDKLSHDFHGDPASALLEVLDPEQNHSFSDHYLETTFDLSKVMFIATANRLDPIAPALRDRMEVIEIPGYTQEEKKHIAIDHLIPKVLEAHGLSNELFELEPEALEAVIDDYTREAGVRNLERMLGTVVRGVAVKVAEGRTEKTVVKAGDLAEYLGPARFYNERAERTEVPGVAIGLAWTEAGGDILFVEATKMSGKGQLTLTGQLGDVMKESVQAARSYLRSRSPELGIPDAVWEKHDIHVHLPAGAIPKDGPSAGVTMATALCSLITGIRVKSDVAMTGELTLRGNVLPVGGIKEKVLAAHRAGVAEVILPERNAKDLVDVPKHVLSEMKMHFVSRVDQVLDLALERAPARTNTRFTPAVVPAPAGAGGLARPS